MPSSSSPGSLAYLAIAHNRLFGSGASLCKCLVRSASSPLFTLRHGCHDRKSHHRVVKVCTRNAVPASQARAFRSQVHSHPPENDAPIERSLVCTIRDQFKLMHDHAVAELPQSTEHALSQSKFQPMFVWLSLFAVTFRERSFRRMDGMDSQCSAQLSYKVGLGKR